MKRVIPLTFFAGIIGHKVILGIDNDDCDIRTVTIIGIKSGTIIVKGRGSEYNISQSDIIYVTITRD